MSKTVKAMRSTIAKAVLFAASALPRGGFRLVSRAANFLPELQSIPIQPKALNGVTLWADLRESVWYPLWRYGCYPHQKGEECVLERVVEPESIVFDVGANIGYLSLFFAVRCPKGRVFAFEPSPRARRYLEKAVKNIPNITIEPVALSDESGEVLFTEEVLLDRSHIGGGPRALHVRSMTLDAWCAEHSVYPDVLKIDVEGDDHRVLSGARETLMRSVRYVMFEALDPRTLSAAIKAMAGTGCRWTVRRIAHDGSLYDLDSAGSATFTDLTNNYLASRA